MRLPKVAELVRGLAQDPQASRTLRDDPLKLSAQFGLNDASKAALGDVDRFFQTEKSIKTSPRPLTARAVVPGVAAALPVAWPAPKIALAASADTGTLLPGPNTGTFIDPQGGTGTAPVAPVAPKAPTAPAPMAPAPVQPRPPTAPMVPSAPAAPSVVPGVTPSVVPQIVPGVLPQPGAPTAPAVPWTPPGFPATPQCPSPLQPSSPMTPAPQSPWGIPSQLLPPNFPNLAAGCSGCGTTSIVAMVAMVNTTAQTAITAIAAIANRKKF